MEKWAEMVRSGLAQPFSLLLLLFFSFSNPKFEFNLSEEFVLK
jgi:hypothetical protein